MDSLFWAKLHGATTHFPIACALCSCACDAVGLAFAQRPGARDLRAVGYWTMIAAALGTFPAVVSGLVMTRGSVLGHGAMRWHHLFVWPAFGLLIALAVWRVVVGTNATRSMLIGYLALAVVAGGLVSAAGYWGGELMLTT
jgi:uncharacterized membrane protein